MEVQFVAEGDVGVDDGRRKLQKEKLQAPDKQKKGTKKRGARSSLV